MFKNKTSTGTVVRYGLFLPLLRFFPSFVFPSLSYTLSVFTLCLRSSITSIPSSTFLFLLPPTLPIPSFPTGPILSLFLSCLSFLSLSLSFLYSPFLCLCLCRCLCLCFSLLSFSASLSPSSPPFARPHSPSSI
jgi:hypothetical protein